MKKILSFIAIILIIFCVIGIAVNESSALTYDFIPINDLPGGTGNFMPYGINDNGQIVGRDNLEGKSFLYDFNTASYSWIIHPDSKNYGGYNYTNAYGINNDGIVSGYYGSKTLGGDRGMFYDSNTDTYSTFQNAAPGSVWTDGYGINELGETVGRSHGSGAYKSDGTTFTDLTNYPGYPWGAANTLPYDVNDTGLVVGIFEAWRFYPGENIQSVLYDSFSQTYDEIRHPGSTSTYLYNINNSNTAVGNYSSDFESTFHGILYDADNTAFYTVDYTGASKTTIYGINNNNWIVGFASGGTAGWGKGFVGIPQTEPVPEPSSFLLLISGIAIVINIRKKN